MDVLVGIGGAPEGVLAAVAMKCLGGNLQGRLHAVNPDDIKNNPDDDFNKILRLEDLCRSEEVLFIAMGVSDGDLLKGVRYLSNNFVKTHTVVMRGATGTVRFIEATHNLDKKPEYARPTKLNFER